MGKDYDAEAEKNIGMIIYSGKSQIDWTVSCSSIMSPAGDWSLCCSAAGALHFFLARWKNSHDDLDLVSTETAEIRAIFGVCPCGNVSFRLFLFWHNSNLLSNIEFRQEQQKCPVYVNYIVSRDTSSFIAEKIEDSEYEQTWKLQKTSKYNLNPTQMSIEHQ